MMNPLVLLSPRAGIPDTRSFRRTRMQLPEQQKNYGIERAEPGAHASKSTLLLSASGRIVTASVIECRFFCTLSH